MQQYQCVKLKEVAEKEGGVSNLLFDTLADWELQLKRSEVRFPGPRP